jgi:AhpD family alkylhydroperoxidase
VLELVHLRASQVNGCSFCVDYHSRSLKQAGESDERLFAVAAWREAPYFTDAERAALALAEAATRIADRADPVPDEIWEEAAHHYDEKGLAAIILMIAMTNLFNRFCCGIDPALSWDTRKATVGRCVPPYETNGSSTVLSGTTSSWNLWVPKVFAIRTRHASQMRCSGSESCSAPALLANMPAAGRQRKSSANKPFCGRLAMANGTKTNLRPSHFRRDRPDC